MDLSTMRSEARLIFGQPDASNSSITESQLTNWAKEAYIRMAVALEVLPIDEDTYDISGATITLESATINVDHVKMKHQPENKWVQLEVKDLDDLINRDADWENATTGKPEWFVRVGTFTARLYPPPNTANDNQSSALKTYGVLLDNTLSGDTETPDLPINLHDLFPYFMAYKAFVTLGELDKAAGQLAIFNDGIKTQRLMSTRFSSTKGWTWGDSDPGALECGS